MEPISSQEVIPDALVSKLVDDMMPTKLFWRRVESSGVLVFWTSNWAIQERIVTALCGTYPFIYGDTLVQFWAAEMIGGLRHLTTTFQPFSLSTLKNEKLIQYRKICVGSNLVVADDVDGENMDGILGRVFRNQLPELSPDLSCYSDTDYPQRDQALSCGFNSTMVLPVLEPSQQCCIGVLEILYTTNIFSYFVYCLLSTGNDGLKDARLETIEAPKIREQIQDVYKSHVEKEIKVALEQVCKTHGLPLALGWVRCAHISDADHDGLSSRSYNNFCVNCEGEILVSIPGMMFDSDIEIFGYNVASWAVPLNVCQGLVGKAVLFHKPYLCRDVCQLSIIEYPLVNCARKSGLTGCFAVCLRAISTGNHEYVIELFLPKKETHIEDLHSYISSILTTMKQQFRTFEVITGDMGNDLFIEVDKFTSFHKELESFKEFPTVNTLSNDGEVLQSNSINHKSVTENFDVLEEPEVNISSKRIPLVTQLKAQNSEKNSCSRKDLEQHFGKKLVDAAEILGVSRSTVKRWCREHNIKRWPSAKRSKLCSFSSIPKQTNVLTRGNAEPISQDTGTDPSCSEPPTNVTLMADTSMITVKAAHGGNFFKFKLSYSSRMADLEEKVIIRTRLGGRTFRMTYLDEENDPISIACDEDLHDCMEDLRLSGMTTIRMQIEPIANKSP